jgi:type I restriction enzyme R subunit
MDENRIRQAVRLREQGLTFTQIGQEMKLTRSRTQRLLTDIVSLVRFAVGESVVLEPFADLVDGRFYDWMEQQMESGKRFTEEQIQWLTDIKDYIATSLKIGMDDFDEPPFSNRGGRVKVYQVFGDSLPKVLDDLNEVLVA